MTTAIDYPFVAPTIANRWPPHPALATLRAAASGLHKMVRNGFAAAQRARDRRALRALDSATLRDLGVHVSEIDSFLAEAAGEAELTRLRVACAAGIPLGRSLTHL